jgi:hypothetical protein
MSLTDKLMETFDATFSTFDTHIWTTLLPHRLRSIPGTGELEYYSDASVGYNPFSVAGGVLSITAAPGNNPADLPYNSGIITTQRSFAQLYGYFQITAGLPSGTGLWPAFWMLPAALSGTQEIDVMEAFGGVPGQYSATLHSPANGIDGIPIQTTNLTDGFHSYGVYWTPTTISFWFDETQVAVAPTPSDLNRPMFLLADLAVASDVNAQTQFPASLQISSITAFAYNPSIPGPAAPLTVSVPASASGPEGVAMALTAISIADSEGVAGIVSVGVSDKSLGILWITPQDGVTITVNDSWTVQFSGSLAAVNTVLATLGYRNDPTGATAPTTDVITVSAHDSAGDMDSQHIALSLLAAPPPQIFTFAAAAPQRVLAHPDEVFAFDNGAIVDPRANAGLADHIVDFQPGTDFLAFHNFGASAQLVFDHLAAPGGVPDPTMQYYRVVSSQGTSLTVLVQVANGDTAHLGAGSYGFYPT